MARSKLRGLSVAGLRIAVEVPPDLPWEWPRGPLRRFASPATNPDMRVGVRLGALEEPAAESVRYDSGGGIFDVAHEAGQVVIALRIRGELQRVARFDPDFREGEVVISPDSFYAREAFYPLAYPLDEVLFLHRIVREGGLLIHACGLRRDGAGLIFTGPSGAGKTTIARLMQKHAGAEILSDDRIVMRRSERGFVIHGTPWHGEAPLSVPAETCLTAIHVIRHAPTILAESLAGASAAGAVLGNAFLPAHDPVGAAAALEFAARLVAQVPVVRLGFPKDERIVRYAFGPTGASQRPARAGRAESALANPGV